MDILEQYEKQNPEKKQALQETYEDPSQDYGPIIRWIMKVSGGRIQDVRQANVVLLGVAVCISGVSIYLIFSSGGSGHPVINAPPPETVDNNTRLR